jgi:serine/threonine protein kinase
MRHLQQHQVVHLDLQPCNVLLEKTGTMSWQVRLANFGHGHPPTTTDPAEQAATTATDELQSTSTGAERGRLLYADSECLLDMRCDSRCNVWSYGCILSDLFGRGLHYPPNLPASTVAVRVCAGKLRPTVPSSTSVPGWTEAASQLLLRILAQKRADRPDFADIYASLKKLT